MKRHTLIFSLLTLFTFICSSFSQLGIIAGYSLADNSKVEEYLASNNMDLNIYKHNFNGGIMYQYIIEGTGLSLLPGFVFVKSKTEMETGSFGLMRLGLELPLKIFPFNMEGDCNCPDFSMRNKFFEKHFFLMLNTGLNFSFKSNTIFEKINMIDINYKLGIGAGISIPVAKNLIFSPGVNYNLFFDDKWEQGFLMPEQNEDINTSFREIDMELRMVYIFDKR